MKNLPKNTSNVCGIRGATTAKENSKSSIINATTELLEKLISENDVSLDSIAAVFFTTTNMVVGLMKIEIITIIKDSLLVIHKNKRKITVIKNILFKSFQFIRDSCQWILHGF